MHVRMLSWSLFRWVKNLKGLSGVLEGCWLGGGWKMNSTVRSAVLFLRISFHLGEGEWGCVEDR